MEGPILNPAETKFDLPSRDDNASHEGGAESVMSAFEAHLRKWDSTIDHSVATEPGATSELSSALESVQEEREDEALRSAISPILSRVVASPMSYGNSPPPVPTHSPMSEPSLSPSTTKVDSHEHSAGTQGSSGATRHSNSESQQPSTNSTSSTKVSSSMNESIKGSADESDNHHSGAKNGDWGTPFRVRWVIVRSLPFHSTRMLRNPWNKDREVKVSRDGTEIEPFIGRALLDLWDVPAGPTIPVSSSSSSSFTTAQKV